MKNKHALEILAVELDELLQKYLSGSSVDFQYIENEISRIETTSDIEKKYKKYLLTKTTENFRKILQQEDNESP